MGFGADSCLEDAFSFVFGCDIVPTCEAYMRSQVHKVLRCNMLRSLLSLLRLTIRGWVQSHDVWVGCGVVLASQVVVPYLRASDLLPDLFACTHVCPKRETPSDPV